VSLTVYRCGECGRTHFGSASVCPHCGGSLSAGDVSGRGRVHSFTRVHVGASAGESPYLLVLVDLEGAGKVLGRLEEQSEGDPTLGCSVFFSGLSDEGPRFQMEDSAKK